MKILRHCSIRKAAMSGAAAIALLTSAAYGQTAEAKDPAFPAQVDLSIPAQTLDGALTAFADQTGLMLLYAPEVVDGLNAPAIRGEMTPFAALDAMLAGSGVGYALTDSNAILLGDPRVIGGGSSQAVEGIAANAPVAVASAAQAAEPMGPTGEAGEPGIVRGVVRAAGADAGLDGALIRIEETGQTTSTDNLGRFRFANVPAGRYTVTVSYLGFAEVSETFELEAGGDITLPFRLADAVTDVIVVRGYRSSRAISLNQERTAENSSTVLAADLLGNFSGATISDSLRRAPGVAFIPDDDTGDGANIIVRGLSPSLNQVTLNGQSIADGSGLRRAPNLSSLLTESIESVTISKTLLPSQDSSGVGGLVEIETRSPLDRGARFATFSFEESGLGNDFNEDRLISGLVSGVFGSDQTLGVSLSVQYRDRGLQTVSNAAAISIEQGLGPYLPAGVSSIFSLDPTLPYPIGAGTDEIYPLLASTSESDVEDETLSITASLQKQVGNHTDLRLDVTHSVRTQSTYASSNLNGSLLAVYRPASIPELGGEERLALTVENVFGDAFGTGILQNNNRVFSLRPDQRFETTTVSFRGETNHDSWEFDYNVGLSLAADENKSEFAVAVGNNRNFFTPLDPSFLNQSTLNNEFGGRTVSVFRPLAQGGGQRFFLPDYTMEGFQFYNDTSNLPLINARTPLDEFGENQRVSASVSARHNFDGGWLQYIEAGVQFSRSDVERDLPNSTIFYRSAVAGLTIDQLGLEFGPGSLTRVGAAFDFDNLTRPSVEQLLSNVESLSTGPGALLSRSVSDFRIAEEQSRSSLVEDDFAAYLQGRIDIGRLEIIGGVRVTNVEIEASDFVVPTLVDETGFFDFGYSGQFAQRLEQSGSQLNVLPRALVNYRASENRVLRGGYYMTASRPLVSALGGATSFGLDLRQIYGPSGNQPRLRIGGGNPDLEPTITHNFDFSAELYSDNIGVIKASVFYKLIDGLLLTSTITGPDALGDDIVLPDTPDFNNLPTNIFIERSTSVNDEDFAKIYGLELVVERQLDFLPGFWSDFGIYANYTFTESERDSQFSFGGQLIELNDTAFTNSPSYSGSFGVTYTSQNIDATLIYTEQDRRVTRYDPFQLHLNQNEISTLDFSIDYVTQLRGVDVRIFAQGDDLLRNEDESYTSSSIGGSNSVPEYYTGGTYLGGRSFTFGLSATF